MTWLPCVGDTGSTGATSPITTESPVNIIQKN